jgi:hypothetical protein
MSIVTIVHRKRNIYFIKANSDVSKERRKKLDIFLETKLIAREENNLYIKTASKFVIEVYKNIFFSLMTS